MRNSCRAMASLVETYLDGELEPSQSLEVEAHTRSCARCAERVLLDRAVRGSVRRTLSASCAPTALRDRAAATLKAERASAVRHLPPRISPFASARSFGGWFMVAAAAAAALPLGLKVRARNTEMEAVNVTGSRIAVAGASDVASAMDTVIDQLVNWHATPLPPEVTDARDLTSFEPYVGVPVHAPLLSPFGARWLGGRILPVDRRVTAMLQYTMQNGHRVTVYVYDPARIHVENSSLHMRPQKSAEPVYVGHVRGYSVAAAQHKGVGYALTSDLGDEDNVELVSLASP